jgi:hypothetical protein
MSNTETDFVNLAVPAKYYGEMVTHLGKLLAGEETGDTLTVGLTPTGRIKGSERPRREWTVAELKEVKDKIDGRPAVKALLDLMFDRDGKAVPMADYERLTTYSNRQLASALAGFTQMVGRDFDRSNWPFVVSWDDDDGRAIYSIPEPLMELWRKT